MRRRLDGVVSGDHATPAVGPGSERAGARAYEPGDDARLIDWNLTARVGRDLRAPAPRPTARSRRGSSPTARPASTSAPARCEKRDVVLGGRGRVRHAAPRRRQPHRPRAQRHATGSRTDRPARVAPRSWPRSPRCTTRRGRTARPAASPTSAPPCAGCSGAVRRRGQVVVVSDFLDGDRWAARAAPARPARTRSSPCTSPTRASSSCPPSASSRVVDAETGRQRYVNTGSAALRERYAEAAAAARRRRSLGDPRGRRRVPRACRPSATGSPTPSPSPRAVARCAPLRRIARGDRAPTRPAASTGAVRPRPRIGPR